MAAEMRSTRFFRLEVFDSKLIRTTLSGCGATNLNCRKSRPSAADTQNWQNDE